MCSQHAKKTYIRFLKEGMTQTVLWCSVQLKMQRGDCDPRHSLKWPMILSMLLCALSVLPPSWRHRSTQSMVGWVTPLLNSPSSQEFSSRNPCTLWKTQAGSDTQNPAMNGSSFQDEQFGNSSFSFHLSESDFFVDYVFDTKIDLCN